MHAMLLMPFREEFNNIHDTIKDAIGDTAEFFRKAGDGIPRAKELAEISPDRVDYGHGAEVILTDLKKRILSAEICIVDLSGLNQNVIWEFGFVHALEKSAIVITQQVATELPFDLQQFRVLVYDRNDLKQSLRGPLTKALIDVLQKAPERTSFPEDLSHAQTLAMATSAPTYFLDSEFRIRFMNHAARLLFFTGQYQPISDVTGVGLDEFLISQKSSLLNLPQIQRNLYLQGEQLKTSDTPSPCHFEEIQFRSKMFGDMTLHKAGLAVRDPATGRINGWVVTFNIAEFARPEASEEFHRQYTAVVEYEFTAPEDTTSQKASPPKSPADLAWTDAKACVPLSEEPRSFTYHWARGYGEKKACFDYALTTMFRDQRRYGLKSVRYLPEWFFDFDRTEYLIVEDRGIRVAVCRITLSLDISPYLPGNSILRDAADTANPESFADVGAYFHEILTSPERRVLVSECLGIIMNNSETNGCPFQYVQVPSQFKEIYKGFGFIEAGTPFVCEGWADFRWVPMLVSPFWLTGDQTPPSKSKATLAPQPPTSEYITRIVQNYRDPPITDASF